MNASLHITSEQLRRAADIQDKIESLNSELSRILRLDAAPENSPHTGSRRQMSAAGRAQISAAAKRRWAEFRTGQGSAKSEPKSKRRFSAARRAAISAAAKARWAKAKAAGRNRL